MARAWAVDGLSASEKLVLLRLADWSNAEGLCWYSYAKLGAFVGLQRRQVLRVVAALAERGLVRVVSRFNEKTGLQMSNVLWVLPSDDRKPGDVLKDASNAVRGRLVDGHLQASEGVIQDTPRGVVQDTPRGVTQDTQNLQRNLQRNLQGSVPLDPSSLTPYQRSAVLAGQSVFLAGVSIRPDTPEGLALAQAVRAYDAEKRAQGATGAKGAA